MLHCSLHMLTFAFLLQNNSFWFSVLFTSNARLEVVSWPHRWSFFSHSLTAVWILIKFHHPEISCSYIGWKSIRSIGRWNQQNKLRCHFPNRSHWLELCRKQSKKGNVVKGKTNYPNWLKMRWKQREGIWNVECIVLNKDKERKIQCI